MCVLCNLNCTIEIQMRTSDCVFFLMYKIQTMCNMYISFAAILLRAYTKSNARNTNRQTYLDQVHFTSTRANQSALPSLYFENIG